MATQRWILKFLGDATSLPKTRMKSLLKGASIHVIDMSLFPKLLLVEGSEEKMNELKTQINLTFTPEKSYKVPDARKKIR